MDGTLLSLTGLLAISIVLYYHLMDGTLLSLTGQLAIPSVLYNHHCLIMLYNCMKFHLNSFNGCQLTERTQNSIANDQR